MSTKQRIRRKRRKLTPPPAPVQELMAIPLRDGGTLYVTQDEYQRMVCQGVAELFRKHPIVGIIFVLGAGVLIYLMVGADRK